MTRYTNFIEAAEALINKEIEYLSYIGLDNDQVEELESFHDYNDLRFPGKGLDGDEVRVWFCLFVNEATKESS